jgi:hypothetical protein
MQPSIIVDRYWRYKWKFTANGDLHVYHPAKRLVIREADYVPKAQRISSKTVNLKEMKK